MTKHIYKLLSLVVLTTLLLACRTERTTEQAEIVVTIAPLKHLVEQITGDDFTIGVLVPASASPETYEPTPKQFIALNEASMVFSTGLIDFETSLTERMRHKERLVDLSRGINLIAGHCSHNHPAKQQPSSDSRHSQHTHNQGIDPHIWTSPQELKQMAHNAHRAIIQQYPDSVKYTDSYNALIRKLNELDVECRDMCEASPTKAFVIYHPALTYFARAYDLEQIAIENEGKEPSAKHLANIIEQAKAKGVRCLLYQVQYPRSAVEVVAKDMGVECYAVDPLKENIIDNIYDITLSITGHNKR